MIEMIMPLFTSKSIIPSDCYQIKVLHGWICLLILLFYLFVDSFRHASLRSFCLSLQRCGEAVHSSYMQRKFDVQFRDAIMGTNYLLLMYDVDYPRPCDAKKLARKEIYLYLATVFTSPEDGAIKFINEYSPYADHGEYREMLHRIRLGMWVYSNVGRIMQISKYRYRFKMEQLLDALRIKAPPTAEFEFRVGTGIRLRGTSLMSKLRGSAIPSTMGGSFCTLALSVFATFLSLSGVFGVDFR